MPTLNKVSCILYLVSKRTFIDAHHARIQEFSSREVQVSLTKKALTFFFCFFSPQLILQKSNGQFQRNLSFFKVPEGVQNFPGGGPTFSRGGPIAYSL